MPLATKKNGMKRPKPIASSLRRNSRWVCASSRSISFRIAPATKAPRIASNPNPSARATKAIEQHDRAPHPDLGRRVLQPQQHRREAPPVLDPGERQRRRDGEHHEPADQQELGAGRRRLAGEEEGEQDDRAEVGDRGGDDHELTEVAPDLAGVLQHRDHHAERRGGQHDRHEQRGIHLPARLQREPGDEGEGEGDDEPAAGQLQDRPPQPLEVDLQPGQEQQ